MKKYKEGTYRLGKKGPTKRENYYSLLASLLIAGKISII
jgi:hypothetical protein